VTREELRRVAQELVERTTRQQGLPFHEENESVLAKVAMLLAAPRDAEGGDAHARAS
jgi:hypothetical protein